MKKLLEALRSEFPRVKFSVVGDHYEPRNEDAHYPHGAPKPILREGVFVRMENARGGADTVRASDVQAVRKLAAFHQLVGL